MTLKANDCNVIALYCDSLTCSNSSLFLPAALRLCAFPFSHPTYVLSSSAIPHQLSISTPSCVLNFTTVLAAPLPFSPSQRRVRAMSLRVSALLKDLFVFLRLHSHHPSTLRTTARYLSSDTASYSYLSPSVSRLQKNAAHHRVLFGSTHASIRTAFLFWKQRFLHNHVLARLRRGICFWKLETALFSMSFPLRDLYFTLQPCSGWSVAFCAAHQTIWKSYRP